MAKVNNPDTVYSLPQESYLSEDIYKQELKKIFYRQWLMVGHVSLARNPGDYFVKQIGPESMIIVRDESGELHACFNVCRHRGSRVLDDGEQGTKKKFTCPYHNWSYRNDGCLIAAPGAEDGEFFDYADFSLKEARCDTWYGWIFIYLGTDEPAPLSEVVAPVSNEEALRAIEPEKLKLAHRETYHIEANWKVLYENNLECYHCNGGHPSLSFACDFEKFYGGTSIFDADENQGQHFPLRKGMETFSMDGKRVSKPLGTPQEDGFSTGFILMPMFCGPVFFVDHAVSLEVTPLTIDSTQLIAEWYVREDAIEGADYDVKELIDVFHITNQEDGAFAERNFNGIKSKGYTPGPVNPMREGNIISGYELYHKMMAAD